MNQDSKHAGRLLVFQLLGLLVFLVVFLLVFLSFRVYGLWFEDQQEDQQGKPKAARPAEDQRVFEF